MPKGPQGQKRPTDTVQSAIMSARIATGEIIETLKPKDIAAIARGKKGGAKGGSARAESMTPEQRSKIAKKAAKRDGLRSVSYRAPTSLISN
jgi:hypothetical protein